MSLNTRLRCSSQLDTNEHCETFIPRDFVGMCGCVDMSIRY